MIVERIGRTRGPVAERRQPRRTGIPVRHAVRGGAVLDVEVAGGAGGFEHPGRRSPHGPPAPASSSFGRVATNSSCSAKPSHGPRQAAGPGRKRRIALLAVRSPVAAVGDVEEALVGRAAAHVVGVAAMPVVDGILGGRARVLDQPVDQADRARPAPPSRWCPSMCDSAERAQRPNGVDEQRMRAVERVDVAAVRQRRPARRLDGAADLQRQLVEAHFPRRSRRCAPRGPAATGRRRC